MLSDFLTISFVNYHHRISLINKASEKRERIRYFVHKVFSLGDVGNDIPTQAVIEQLMWRSLKLFQVFHPISGITRVENCLCLVEFVRQLHLYKNERQRIRDNQMDCWYERVINYYLPPGPFSAEEIQKEDN